MNRKEKFKQANREANATWLALLIVIVFWCVAGFGLADVKVEFFQTPLWVWAGCIGTWLFAIVVSVVLANCIFKDMNLTTRRMKSMGNFFHLWPVLLFLAFMLGVSFGCSELPAATASRTLLKIILSAAAVWAVLSWL